MKSNLLKTIAVISLIILLFSCINMSYARDTNIEKLNIGELDDYNGGSDGENSDKVVSKIKEILGFIQLIGIILSVAVLIVLGIKYMMGSVEEKASYKHSFIPYLIGAFILFSGTYLPNVIYSILNS